MLTNHWQEIDVTVVEIRPSETSKMFGFSQRAVLDTGEDIITVRMEIKETEFVKGEDFKLDNYKVGQKYKWRIKKCKPWGYIGYPFDPDQEQVLKPEAPRGKDVHRAAMRKEHENAGN